MNKSKCVKIVILNLVYVRAVIMNSVLPVIKVSILINLLMKSNAKAAKKNMRTAKFVTKNIV